MAWVHLDIEIAAELISGIVDRLDSGSGNGTLELYDGASPISTTMDTGASVLLSRHELAKPSFTSQDNGPWYLVSNLINNSAEGTGKATWARLSNSDGFVVADLSVGPSGEALTLSNVDITEGDTLIISEGVISLTPG